MQVAPVLSLYSSVTAYTFLGFSISSHKMSLWFQTLSEDISALYCCKSIVLTRSWSTLNVFPTSEENLQVKSLGLSPALYCSKLFPEQGSVLFKMQFFSFVVFPLAISLGIRHFSSSTSWNTVWFPSSALLSVVSCHLFWGHAEFLPPWAAFGSLAFTLWCLVELCGLAPPSLLTNRKLTSHMWNSMGQPSPRPSGIKHTSSPLQMVVNKKRRLKMLTKFKPAKCFLP